jgi:uncharacterized protein YjbI with pentapeptide repeats
MQSKPNDVRRVDPEQIDPPCEEPEEEEPVIDIPKLRELPPDELKKIRRQHQKWLETKGRKGKQADLSFANLQQAALGGANLRQVWFRGANLQQASFHASSLREAHLQNANLTGATGLLASQLAGANVSGATLPKNIHEFKELEQVEKITQKAQKLFLSVLLVCVYCWLTIATTTDVGLLTHSGSSPLPIIQTNIPLAGFYWTAPLVLLGLFFWFHLYLQRLWEQLAKLPAVFPDGKTLNEKVYPWLVSGLVCSHVQLLRKRRPPLSRLQTGLSILLAWWVVPGTFAFFWLRYLPKHHWAGTIEHIMLLVVACIFAAWTQALAKKTLRGQLWPSLPLTQKGEFVAWFISFLKRSWKLTFFGMMIFLLAAVISDGAIQGIPPPKPVYTPQKGEQALRAERPPPPTRPAGGLLNHLMRRYRTIIPELLPSIPLVGARAFADLSAQDVSTRPPNWTLMREEAVEDIVLGAQLRKTDLRAALAHQAFLVKADLREANLQEADFSQANLAKGNLQKANFQEAILREANLREADLFQAQLLNADLQKGNLVRANLQKADLISANLEEANLEEANLRGANLQWVNLQGANLQKALMEVKYIARKKIICSFVYIKKLTSNHDFV